MHYLINNMIIRETSNTYQPGYAIRIHIYINRKFAAARKYDVIYAILNKVLLPELLQGQDRC